MTSIREVGNGGVGGFKRWAALLVSCILLAAACKNKPAEPQKGPAQKPPTSVLAAEVRKGDISVYLAGLGTVTPVATVTVKSRVDGQLNRVLFKEGQVVRRGDLLAEIDPRPFEADMLQAEGALARDQAQLRNAHLDLQRFQDLFKKGYVSSQQLDAQSSLVHQYEGAVKANQGQIDNVRLKLSYARITAPISGRIGFRQVDQGNIIHATDQEGLAVITQLQPITAVFSIPEDSLPQVLKRLKNGSRLKVDAFDREQKQRLAEGSVLTVDNQIDPTTGTVKVKAEFPNSGNELFPNQFVNLRMLVDVKKDSVIIPTASIQRGPQGTFVYVVKEDSTVDMRKIVAGVSQGGDTSVTDGLTPGEKVVVEGAERLKGGSKVQMREKEQKGDTKKRRN